MHPWTRSGVPAGGMISVVGLRRYPSEARSACEDMYRCDAGRRTPVVKVDYVFSTSGHTASYKLGKMILPQLEQGIHGVEVVGLFFFDDNNYILRKGDPIGERLAKVAQEQGILLMMCDQCAVERGLAEGVAGDCRPSGSVAGVRVGCFPDL